MAKVQEISRNKSIAERFEPYGEQVLVRRIDADDEKTAGGVIKPEIARQRANRGTVVALGEGRYIQGVGVEFGLTIGDIVRFSRYGGTEVDIDGETLLLLHWKQIYLRERCEDSPNA